ncbi:hypothetical protein L596_008701 [Steinernema carpocapsae]|uniref:Uncharacterized protein n=1 Tax=Steinernema carpocapsae TaxID=34508 RepID=A0A4U5PDI9_STECR|nr:hypothetical protein L596_008701 [Steinernema carpocapsae]
MYVLLILPASGSSQSAAAAISCKNRICFLSSGEQQHVAVVVPLGLPLSCLPSNVASGVKYCSENRS